MDQRSAECIVGVSDKLAAAIEEIERLRGLLAAAAKELPHCSGPVHERIAVYRREHAKQIEQAERRAEHWAEKSEAAWKAGDELTMQRMQAERRAERLKGHAEAMANAGIAITSASEIINGNELADAIAAYRADKGE